MSSVVFNAIANTPTFFAAPANISAATIYTCAVPTATLISLNIACSGAADATVWINDGSTDWLLLDAETQTVNETKTKTFGNPTLRDGDSVKIKTSVADDLTFTLVMAEETSS